MKKTIVSVILTISLLFSLTAFVSAENVLKPNASNNISSEVSEKLKEHIDYDCAIRIYTVGMYFHDFADGKTLDDIVNTFPDSAEIYFALKISLNEFEYGTYSYKDGEMKKLQESDAAALYEWIDDTLNAKTISIEGIGDMPITNVYCLRTYSPPRVSVIIYQTPDQTYYALYDKGIDHAPAYMSEETFMKCVSAYVEKYNSYPNYNEDGEALNYDVSLSLDSLGLETLNISLSSKECVYSTVGTTTANNYVTDTDDEKNEGIIKIMIAAGSVACVLTIAVITVSLVKRKRKTY
ncbi:MAG: hypothetical protein E7670_05800 [Ruminococcaceae bacterium]|nr:hypothetical protein [Oscillospiraceae bacterium]